ncbi:E3 ubiquitin-protein ligase hel2 [Thalictrum thalictroides]|uniref:RING-type E3 ubiquitin transferase n=1 Tax=Thalictrum thalictroides TaxID=46969 RepID=A0A7J6X699_THATH|nr:E3 ubiquitin-protein ligase hel2 [Thalictrum thalictroides]
MDDSCAVCAETLEWVAYGACGHREVCSTCVSRLRFICEDRRCCICKTESDVVFVTKALGDYTTTISDFSVFQSNAIEGKNGSYWYHEDTGAYFDDSDHYKMIKAMCRLSCSVCDKVEDQGGNDGSKRKGKFRNIDQLKSHLFHKHKLVMCSLCLEGRKIFICEQKLYTRAQLLQHINTGDSEVDGSESERGGFMGHPMCEFCRKPFYGDNELYSHMSTEHFTCHICQRQHPGQFEYYKNYDDLEMHFRSAHFLCESEACLAKKFIVFTSESEMKRHNALEHGGNMSRSKRNAVLQIPTSFRYRKSNEDDNRRGRGRGYRPDSSENQLSLAIQASLETSTTDDTNHDPSSSTRSNPNQRDMRELDDIVPPFESLATTDSEGSLRYLQALGPSSRNVPLGESSFPPLPVAPPSSTQPNPRKEGLGKNTMAARLRKRNNGTINVLNSARPWSSTNPGLASSSSTSSQARTLSNHGLMSPISTGSPIVKPAITNGSISSSHATSAQARTTLNHGLASSSIASSYASSAQARPATDHGLASASLGSSSWNTSTAARVSHSISAPNLVERGSLDSSMSDFPPVSVTKKDKLPVTSPPKLKVEDVQTANKSLVERIRSSLEFDEDKYSAFKEISAEFRQGVIGSGEYLSYVQQFGLSHLVFELASLCPDPKKQRELLETYNASVRGDSMQENGLSISDTRSKGNKGSKKGKGKCVEAVDSGPKQKLPDKSFKDTLADNIIGTVKKLQSSYNPLDEEVEVLSKDGYRSSKANSNVTQPVERLQSSFPNSMSNGQLDIQSAGAGSSVTSGGGGGGKQRKKTSKFHRVRLGDSFDRQSDVSPEHERTSLSKENSKDGVPVRGVWRNGGGQRLVSQTQKGPAK